MITAQNAAIAPALCCLFLAVFLPGGAAAAEANAARQTAAQLDWTPVSALDDPARATVPWFCNGAYIAPPLSPQAAINGPGVVTATATSLQHKQGGASVFSGDVLMTQDARSISSPRIEMTAASEVAEITGPLVIREEGLVMTGAAATSDLVTGEGVIDSATFLLHESGFRGSADRIVRNANADLVLTNSIFTRCEPDSRAWSLRGSTVDLREKSGFGTARHVTLRVRDVPVAYFPWIRFPLTDARQSGFLTPSAGYDSTNGTELIVPYYFNLAPEYDATYELKSLWKRGLVHDGQVRFLAGQSANTINLGFLAGDDIFGGEIVQNQATGETVTLPPTEKQDRWYINARHQGNWSRRVTSTINYSAVSDGQYLQDIGGDFGSSSLDRFTNSIDQSLSSRRAPALERKGQLKYRGDAWNTSLTVLGFQNLELDQSKQYELLPRLASDFSRRYGPAQLRAGLELTSFDKNTEGLSGPGAIVGERSVVDMSLSLRKSTSWGYIEPAIGVIHRNYNLDDTPVNARTHPEVTTPRLSLDTGLIFDRFFSAAGVEMQQTLEPRLFFLYVEEDFQDDLPQFDASPLTPGFSQLFRTNRFSGYDRIGDARQVSLAVTSRLLKRRTGTDVLNASLGQIFYLKDREVVFRRSPADDPEAGESPLFARAGLTFPGGLGLTGSYEWEPRFNRSNRGTISLRYADDARKIFNLNYTFTSPAVQPLNNFSSAEESDVSLIWPIKGPWSAIGRWNFSWDRHQTIESFAGFEYDDCCWRARIVVRRFLKEPEDITVIIEDPTTITGFRSETVTDFPADTGIFFEFELKGLSTLGGRLNTLLEEAIPGYRQ